MTETQPRIVFIGASSGGIEAMQRLLMALEPDFDLPIVVVQHLPADANFDPALVFRSRSHAVVSEATEKEPIEKGHIYFAPPGYHLLIEKDHHFALSQDNPVLHARPSIDVLFESAAVAYGQGACGVLLTGSNADGAAGLKAMKDEGAIVFVQSPDEAESPTMPRSGIAATTPDFVGGLDEIASQLSRLARKAQE